MDNTLELKERIHEFIDRADERTLKIINAIITSEESEEEELSPEHKAILDERLQEYRNNPTSGKFWKEVRQDLKNEYGI
ncbi:addiction module family protein [Chryseobacterium nematophagum]|uniref:Addiction module family protein n=1 Tax=Chryseobacterium nematophagum TaxID=2305228 RepID=A0A3M7TD21_9FLAO|nr:addiction module protein [Chryseobacterium nematophagum]RNA61482.1 addiction module family protein [Chryseobacterium nematophagum]